RSLAPRRWLRLATEHRNFALYTTLTTMVDLVGLQAPTMIFAKYFSLNVVGQLAVATRVLDLPAALISQAAAQVFYRSAAKRADRPHELRSLVEQTACYLFLPALVVFCTLMLHGPALFEYVLGQRWSEAGRYAQILAPWLLVRFVSSPLSSFVLVKGAQRK